MLVAISFSRYFREGVVSVLGTLVTILGTLLIISHFQTSSERNLGHDGNRRLRMRLEDKAWNLVGQIARCHCDVRWDSTGHPQIASDERCERLVFALAMCKPLILLSYHTGNMRDKSWCEISCDIGLRCKFICVLDSHWGLAWDGSAHYAKSLAMWVERCKPLRPGLSLTGMASGKPLPACSRMNQANMSTQGNLDFLSLLGEGGGEQNARKKARNHSRGLKRDKLHGTNRAEFQVLRRFLQIFRFSWEFQHVGGADFAENCRKPQMFGNPLIQFSFALLIFLP